MTPITLFAGVAENRAPTTPRTIAVVGNAPGVHDHRDAIDAADRVVRFNNAAGHGGRTGRRVTHLVLVNFGGQMREWLDDPGFLDRPSVRDAGEFLLPIHPGDDALNAPRRTAEKRAAPGEHDWTREAVARLAALGRPVRLLPGAFEEDCARLLARERGDAPGTPPPPPSTGFLAMRHLLESVATPQTRIDCYGFGFAGWDGHAWEAERRWFERRAAEGRLVLHPLAS